MRAESSSVSRRDKFSRSSAIVGLLVVALLSACGEVAPRQEGDAGRNGKRVVTVTHADKGSSVVLRHGDELVVSLGTEEGDWIVTRHPRAVEALGLVGEGAPHHRFRAVRPGSGRIVIVALTGLDRQCGTPGDVPEGCYTRMQGGNGPLEDDSLATETFVIEVRIS